MSASKWLIKNERDIFLLPVTLHCIHVNAWKKIEIAIEVRS